MAAGNEVTSSKASGEEGGGKHCCEAIYQMAAGNEVTSSKASVEVGKREGVDTVVKQHIFQWQRVMKSPRQRRGGRWGRWRGQTL